MSMNQKNIQKDCFEIKHLNQKGLFSGYASVFNVVDGHQDIIAKGAFKDAIIQAEQNNSYPKMLWQHQVENPLGQWLHMEEDDHGLYVEGQFLMNLAKAQEAYDLIKTGIVQGLSIGFTVLDAEIDSKTGVRLIKSADLVEISVVTFAANAQAKVNHIKKS